MAKNPLVWDFGIALLGLILISPTNIWGQPTSNEALQPRAIGEGISFREYEHLRNAHACIMSIVFIVLYPLGAIAIHLPIDYIPFLRNTYLTKKVMAIHAPIQGLGLIMMIGAMGIGIKLADYLGYFDFSVSDSMAHIVIGLLTCCLIILFQPVMGFVQHRYYKKHGGKSVFAYAHRWLGRITIILGIINNGLGFWLAQQNRVIPTGSYVRNFVIAGILVLIWWALALWDAFFRPNGPDPEGDGGEKGVKDGPMVDNTTPATAS